MAEEGSIEKSWNVNLSLRLLQSVNLLIRQENNTEFNLKKLRGICESFYQKSLENDYISALDSSGISLLEKQVHALAELINLKEASAHKTNRHVIPLKICLLMVIRYVTCKTDKFQKINYICNAMKLAVETAIACYDAQQWHGMQFCLNMTDYYEFVTRRRLVTQLEPEYQTSNIFSTRLFYIARILWFYARENHYEILQLLSNEKPFSLELSVVQRETISKICFNIGLHYFKTKLYEQAVIWLKYSYTLGPSNQQISNVRSNKSASLVLLAACYFHINAMTHSWRIAFLLNRSGNKMMIKELVFSTLLTTKNDDSTVLSSAMVYLSAALDKSAGHMRESLEMVFVALEGYHRFEVIEDLLNLIPWNASRRTQNPHLFQRLSSETLTDIRWTCASVAVRYYLKNCSFTSCFRLLNELAELESSYRGETVETVQEMLATVESHALQLCAENQWNEAAKWYTIIAKILQRNDNLIGRLIPSVLCNGIRCCIQAANPLNKISNSLQFILNCNLQIDDDCRILYWKLYIAVSVGDRLKATEISLQLDAMHKTKNIEIPEDKSHDWETTLEILEKSILLALKNNMGDIVIHSLNALMHECNRVAAFQTGVYVYAIRVHLMVLFRFGSQSEIVETKCIDNLISALISSYLQLKDFSDGIQGEFALSNGLDCQFASTAWELGHMLTRPIPFYRHQLFKVSYKLYSLCEQTPKVKEKMEMAIILSVAAAINTLSYDHSQPYSEILHKSLDLTKDFFTKFSDSPHTNLIRLYEFYILCELGHLKRAEDEIQIYISDPNPTDKRNPALFEGLAALSSSCHENLLLQILPPMEAHQFRVENRRHRPIQQQLKLTSLAIQCLKVANSFLDEQHNPSLIPRICNNWLKITSMASEYALLQEDMRAVHFHCCHEYTSYISSHSEKMNSSSVIPFLAQVWNTSLTLATYHEDRIVEAGRWFQMANKLMAIFPELKRSCEEKAHFAFEIL